MNMKNVNVTQNVQEKLQKLKVKKYVYDNLKSWAKCEKDELYDLLSSQENSKVINNLVKERCILIKISDESVCNCNCDLSGIFGYPGLHIDYESNYGTCFNISGDKVFWFDAFFEYCNYQLGESSNDCIYLFYHHEGTFFQYVLMDTGVYSDEIDNVDNTTIKVLEYKERLLNVPLESYKLLTEKELNDIIENCKKEITTRNISDNFTTKTQYKLNKNYLHFVKYTGGITITENDIDPTSCDDDILGKNFTNFIIVTGRRYISYEEIVINLNNISDFEIKHKFAYDWDICDNLKDYKILPDEFQDDVEKLKDYLFNHIRFSCPHVNYEELIIKLKKLK